MLKSKFSIILFSALNAILMTVFTFLWINKSYILTDDEEYMIKSTSGIRNTLLGLKKKPNPEEFLFVDIAWEKQLVKEKKFDGQLVGNRAITNRKRIAEFLSYVNKTNAHKFIILDVFLKDKSDQESDSLLQAEFSKTKNILIPYHTEDGVPDMPMFKAPVALSDYDKDDIDNNFVKFKSIFKDTLKTTPMVMYETLHGKKFTDHGLYGTCDGKLALSSFILDMRIWRYNLSTELEKAASINDKTNDSTTVSYETFYLSDLLYDQLNPAYSEAIKAMPAEERPDFKMIAANDIAERTKDRIIVIGDFSDADIHETIYGATPGPLILLNVYLALREGDNLFSIWFILFLFTGFFFISYNCFSGKDAFVSFVYKLSKKIKQFNRASFFLNFMSYLLYFILLSILSFFLFNIHITILLLAVYMEVLEKVVQYFTKKPVLPGQENTVKTN